MAKQKKEVAAKAAQNVSTYVDDFDDFDEMGSEDLVIPRAAVMQGGSQLVKDGKAVVGSIWDTTQQRELVPREETGEIIPLVMFKDWIEWNPDRGSEEKIIDRTRDKNSDLAKRARAFEKVEDSDGREKVAVTESYNFFALFPQAFGLTYDDIIEKPELIDECIVWINFNRTMHKLGKLWLNRLKMLKATDPRTGEKTNARMFAAKWSITSKMKTRDGDDWFVYDVGSYELLPPEVVVVLSEKASQLRQLMDAAIEADTKAGADGDFAEVDSEDDN